MAFRTLKAIPPENVAALVEFLRVELPMAKCEGVVGMLRNLPDVKIPVADDDPNRDQDKTPSNGAPGKTTANPKRAKKTAKARARKR